MIGIRDTDGRFWSAPGLTWDEALKTSLRWRNDGIRACRALELPDDYPEVIAMLADFEADEVVEIDAAVLADYNLRNGD